MVEFRKRCESTVDHMVIRARSSCPDAGVTLPAEISRTCCRLRRRRSHHLKVLKRVELSECRKEGQFVDSRTIPETSAESAELLVLFSRNTRKARSSRNSKRLRGKINFWAQSEINERA